MTSETSAQTVESAVVRTLILWYDLGANCWIAGFGNDGYPGTYDERIYRRVPQGGTVRARSLQQWQHVSATGLGSNARHDVTQLDGTSD